jgi:hypothetical protein
MTAVRQEPPFADWAANGSVRPKPALLTWLWGYGDRANPFPLVCRVACCPEQARSSRPLSEISWKNGERRLVFEIAGNQ